MDGYRVRLAGLSDCCSAHLARLDPQPGPDPRQADGAYRFATERVLPGQGTRAERALRGPLPAEKVLVRASTPKGLWGTPVDIDGQRDRRLKQASSATYYGRWGAHEIEEALYREVGLHNGPTVKPIEVRAGIVARRMTPDVARIVGELSAEGSSRQIEATMRTTSLVPCVRDLYHNSRALLSQGDCRLRAPGPRARGTLSQCLRRRLRDAGCRSAGCPPSAPRPVAHRICRATLRSRADACPS
jgi:hypothetical protein